jgi:hypothetical protein
MRRWPLEALGRIVANDWALSTGLGVVSFVFAVLLHPPAFLLVLLFSVPFFISAFRADWKSCISWTIVTIPFQYYFNIGGLALTLTELYIFLFSGLYFLSRVAPSRSVLLPSRLAVPFLYSLTPLLPALTGHLSVVKEGVRLIAAVFFCPQLSRRNSPRLISSAF